MTIIVGENCVGLQLYSKGEWLGTYTASARGSHGDVLGLCISNQAAKSLKKVLAKSLNKNQILVLKKCKENKLTITSLLDKICREEKIPISTLKLNSKVLKGLGLLDFGDSRPAGLTETGNIVLKIMEGHV